MARWLAEDYSALLAWPGDNQTAADALDANYLANASFAETIVQSGLFPQLASGNTTLDVFNVTARVSTDICFRCLIEATVIAAVKNKAFPVTYAYEFGRSYQAGSHSAHWHVQVALDAYTNL